MKAEEGVLTPKVSGGRAGDGSDYHITRVCEKTAALIKSLSYVLYGVVIFCCPPPPFPSPMSRRVNRDGEGTSVK